MSMKYFLSLLLILFTSIAIASENATLILDVSVHIDGELVSQPRFLSAAGQTASIESVGKDGHGYSITVTPTLKDDNQVHMKFEVATLHNDKKTIVSTPQLITLVGQSAEITQVSKDDPKRTMSLTVIPTLKE